MDMNAIPRDDGKIDPKCSGGKSCNKEKKLSFDQELALEFYNACSVSPWWCEIAWKSYIDSRPEIQFQLAMWESFASTLALVLTGPFMIIELPFYILMFYLLPGSLPPAEEPSYQEDELYTIWSYFSLWISKRF